MKIVYSFQDKIGQIKSDKIDNVSSDPEEIKKTLKNLSEKIEKEGGKIKSAFTVG